MRAPVTPGIHAAGDEARHLHRVRRDVAAQTLAAGREHRLHGRVLGQGIEPGAAARIVHGDFHERRPRHVADDDAIVEVEGAGVLGAGQRLLDAGLREQQQLRRHRDAEGVERGGKIAAPRVVGGTRLELAIRLDDQRRHPGRPIVDRRVLVKEACERLGGRCGLAGHGHSPGGHRGRDQQTNAHWRRGYSGWRRKGKPRPGLRRLPLWYSRTLGIEQQLDRPWTFLQEATNASTQVPRGSAGSGCALHHRALRAEDDPAEDRRRRQPARAQ